MVIGKAQLARVNVGNVGKNRETEYRRAYTWRIIHGFWRSKVVRYE
jgi:hypothetical protein